MVIPVVNCKDFETASAQIKKAISFFPPAGGWIHIDVVDGRFAPNITWGDPEDLSKLRLMHPNISFEIHLMVQDPEDVVESWFSAGAKRVIVHVESINDGSISRVLEIADKYNAEVMLSIAPATSLENLQSYIEKVKQFQVLAVSPGLAGREFDVSVIEKIKFLRQNAPNAKIEVDGGVNLETAKLAKEAGADVFVAASYIFGSDSPGKAYQELNELTR
ncbi:MAG: ribulose-phosphate 3-epimerase [Candidatus Colwellbacteria bacterium]|nr:ribulose-phosphate 3-epimerase [Candidatus Colwellbacteria bacterium]